VGVVAEEPSAEDLVDVVVQSAAKVERGFGVGDDIGRLTTHSCGLTQAGEGNFVHEGGVEEERLRVIGGEDGHLWYG